MMLVSGCQLLSGWHLKSTRDKQVAVDDTKDWFHLKQVCVDMVQLSKFDFAKRSLTECKSNGKILQRT